MVLESGDVVYSASCRESARHRLILVHLLHAGAHGEGGLKSWCWFGRLQQCGSCSLTGLHVVCCLQRYEALDSS